MRLIGRPSPAMIVALLALVLALASTGAVAGTLITGKQVKNRSLTGKDVKKDSLTGTVINESRLGKVPSASSADTVGGLGPDAFIRSDRVLSGSLSSANQPVGSVLFRDAVTGLEVRLGDSSVPRFLNTNSTDTLAVRGLGGVSSTTNGDAYTVGFVLSPGASQNVSVQTITPSYIDVMVVRQVPGNTSAPHLRVSCAYTDVNSTQYLSCTGDR
jgi:hypothetical protein